MSLAFVLAAIACALAALCYAEFASTVPVAGSAYTFSYATFGEFVAWIIGWDLVLEFAVGSAAVAKGWSEYLQTVLGYMFGDGVKHDVDDRRLTVDWGALLLVVVLTALLAVGTKLSSRVSMVITGIKVAIVLFVIFFGLSTSRPRTTRRSSRRASPAASGDGRRPDGVLVAGRRASSAFGVFGLLAGASLVFFAFIGFDVVATTAEETRTRSARCRAASWARSRS